MSIIKVAIQQIPALQNNQIKGGARSNLPNAWINSKNLGNRSDIPLATGINSSFPSIGIR